MSIEQRTNIKLCFKLCKVLPKRFNGWTNFMVMVDDSIETVRCFSKHHLKSSLNLMEIEIWQTFAKVCARFVVEGTRGTKSQKNYVKRSQKWRLCFSHFKGIIHNKFLHTCQQVNPLMQCSIVTFATRVCAISWIDTRVPSRLFWIKLMVTKFHYR